METNVINPNVEEGINKLLVPEHKEPKDRKQGESKPHPEKKLIEEISLITGNITEWLYNKDYVYDSFTMQTEVDSVIVKFPPHLGQALEAGKQTDAKVSLKGVLRTTPKGDKHMKFVSMEIADQVIDDVPPFYEPVVAEFVKGNSIIKDFQYNKKGDIDGYILENKTILKVPPHICNEYKDSVIKGNIIEFTGMQESNKEGEVKAKEYSIIHTRTLSIDGKEYLV